MNITVKEALELHASLAAVGELAGKKFAYVVGRNMRKIETLKGQLGRDFDFKKNYQEYDKERIKLCVKHAEKDEQKKPILVETPNGPNYKMIDIEAFNIDHKALKEKHSEAINERKDQEKAYDKREQEEIDFMIYTIANDFVPEDISANQLQGIWPILMDEAPKDAKAKEASAGLHAVQPE